MFSCSIPAVVQAIRYPFIVVLRSINRSLCGWKRSASRPKGQNTSFELKPTMKGNVGVSYCMPLSEKMLIYLCENLQDDTTAPTDIERDQPTSNVIEVITLHDYYPPGVAEIIGHSAFCYIGIIDESMIMKYPNIEGDRQRREAIEIEAKIYEAIGNHPRIIEFKGLNEHGLLLQRARNGNLKDYITSNAVISFGQRLRWCRQAAEAIEHIHKRHVIHCDIALRNFLLDENLDLLLADFQGTLMSDDGRKVMLDGLSRGDTRSHLARVGNGTDEKYDLFAFGSAVYFIMMGHEIFPELDSLKDEDEEELESRLEKGQFPIDNHLCSHITEKCWRQQYESASEIIFDLSQIKSSS